MEDQLCEAKTAKKLQRTINRLFDAGWQPTGGVAVVQSNSTGHWWFFQAITRAAADVPSPVYWSEPVKPPSNGSGEFA